MIYVVFKGRLVPKVTNVSPTKHMPDFDYIRKELIRNGVNKKLLPCPVTIDEYIQEINAYVQWYNAERIKGSSGWLSPLKYRRSLGLVA
jgi:hypothetical protein